MPFYSLEKAYTLFSYAWRDFSGGIPMTTDLARIPFFWILRLLSSMSISGVLLQAVTFLLLIMTGVWSVYFLLKITIVDDMDEKWNKKYMLYQYIPVVGAIFYLLNPYSMVQIWGRGLYSQFFPFALIPLFLVLFIWGLKRKKIIFGFMALISSFFLSVSFGQPSYILSLMLIMGVLFIFYLQISKPKDRKYFILYFFTISLLWLLINTWWVWPLFKTIGGTAAKLGDLEYNIGSLRGISKDSPLSVVIRLTHKFMFTGTYGNSYTSLTFQLMSWLLPVTLIFSMQSFKKLKYFKFYASIFLVALIIVLGTNMPFGWAFLWLFEKISVLQVFRNPYEKMGLVLMLAYTPFFAIGAITMSLKTRIPAKMLIVILFLISGIYVWPMWTGQFAGGLTMTPWIKVPNYYKLTDEWISSRDSDARIIQFPLNPGDGVFYTWEHPYRGIEPSEFIFSNSSIGRNVAVNKIYYNVLLERFDTLQKNAFGPDPDISKSEFRSDNLYQELSKLNIRFIVLHYDIDEKLSGIKSANETADYLSQQKNIEKVKSIGLLDIYEVNPDVKLNHIHSPNAEITYKKLSPTLYTFNVINGKKPTKIHFLETYNPEWELIVDKNKYETHSRVFSYANSWTIDKEGTYSGYINYNPQNYVDEGTLISKIAMIGLIVMTIISVLITKIGKSES